MTRKTDMASRYAAAHARRDQRRRQAPARQFLPLGEGGEEPITLESDLIAATSARGAAMLTQSRLPSIDYSYLRGDLIRTAVLAIVLFAGMIVLHLFIS